MCYLMLACQQAKSHAAEVEVRINYSPMQSKSTLKLKRLNNFVHQGLSG